MILGELMMLLGLDTSSFTQQADLAIAKGEGVASSISESFEEIQNEASKADEDLDEVEKKSTVTQSILNGLAESAQDVVKEVVEGAIEIGKESLEIASQTGTSIAEEYLRAQERLSVSTEALKLKIGNSLLPAATVFSDFLADLTGVGDSERLIIMFDRLDSYSFENIQRLSESIDSVFGRFEQVEYGEERMNVEDMTAALDSQIEYWNQYNQTLSALQQRGVDASLLSNIADGTMQSYEILKALEEADGAQMETIMQSFETLESVKGNTVAGLNEMQLYVDEDYRGMVQSIAELVAGMDQSEAAYANGLLTGEAVSGGLADAFPNIQSMVNAINDTLSQIGNVQIRKGIEGASGVHYTDNGNESSGNYGNFFASGIPYVPHDDYGAFLHRGEAVLTRQEAEEYRASGSGRAPDNTALLTEVRALKDAILSMQIILNGKTVGRLITSTVNEEIAWQAGVY